MNNRNFYSTNIKLTSQQIAPRSTPVFSPNRIEAREAVRSRVARFQTKFVPRWFAFFVLVMLTFAFCVALNVKSRSEMSSEQQEQNRLQSEIQQIQNGNVALAEEINRLQTDPAVIERAIRERLKMVRANERILVPTR